MREINLNQSSLVSGCGSEMTRAESNESWARTFGFMWAVPGTCLGGVTGFIVSSDGFIVSSNSRNPVAILAATGAGAAFSGIVSYAVPYFITKVTLDHINIV